MTSLPDDVRDRYLERLEVEREAPSVEALFRLHRAHVERVPWETLWIQMDEQWGIDPLRSAERIAGDGRGGYCFHLNGAFGLLLESLGYQVARHVGGVHGPAGPSEDELTNHLVLTVSDLPSEDNPSGVWYVDAGLGDALHDPLPLGAGEYRQGDDTYQLATHTGAEGDWRFVHEPGRGFTGMSWLSGVATMDAFADRHVELSTSDQSPFVRWLVVQRRHAGGADVMKGLSLTPAGASEPSIIESRDELIDALRDVFGLNLADRGRDDLDRLWHRVSAAHEAWLAARAD